MISQKVKLRSQEDPKANSLAKTARKLCIVSVVCGIWLKLYMHVTPCSSLTLICVGCIESPWKITQRLTTRPGSVGIPLSNLAAANIQIPSNQRGISSHWEVDCSPALCFPQKTCNKDVTFTSRAWFDHWYRSCGEKKFFATFGGSQLVYGYCNSWSVTSN